MQVQEKGTPPYKVLTAEIKPNLVGPSQLYGEDTYIKALYRMIDQTNFGMEPFDPETEIKPARIIDSKEEVIFSADNPDDMNLLKLIVQSGLPYEQIEVVKDS